MQIKRLTAIVSFLLIGISLTVCSREARAQQKITRAAYYPSQESMELQMADFIKIDQLPKGILLIDAQNAVSRTLPIVSSNIVGNGRFIQIRSLKLAVGRLTATAGDSSQQFDICSQLINVIVPFRPAPDKPVSSLSAQIEAGEGECRQIDDPILPQVETTGTVEAKEADVLITGAFTAVEDSKPVYVGEVKAEYDLVGDRSPLHVAPFFTLKASTAEKSDPDQFRGGIKFYQRVGAGRLPRPLAFIRAEVTGELEANTEFTVKNILAKPTLQFYMQDIRLSSDTNKDEKVETVVDRARLKFIPSVGLEIGRNVSSPISRSDRTIARIVGGLSLNLIFPETPLKALGFKKIVWENSFTQRWFLRPEQNYKKDDDNNLQLVNFGRQPHPYFISKFNLGLNDFFAPSISYEWGDLPPLYNRINHRVVIGFTFGLKRGVKLQ